MAISKHAIAFDGIGDHVDTGWLFDLGTSDFAFSLWVRTTTTSTGRLFGYSSANSNEVLGVDLNTDESNATVAGKTTWFLRSTDNESRFVSMDEDIYDGAWHHLIFDRSGTSSGIYVDGIAAALTVGSDGLTASSSFNTTMGLYYGAQNRDDSQNSVMVGDLDDPRIYDFAVTASQAEALAAGRELASDPIRHWPFDEGSGSTTEELIAGGSASLNNGASWIDEVPSQLAVATSFRLPTRLPTRLPLRL